MKHISDLTSCVEILDSTVTKDLIIEGIAVHSKKIKTNYAFFVTREKNEVYIQEAFLNGATVVVAERIIDGYPTIQVRDIRKAIALMSRAFFDYPDRNLTIIGVVGTNGKTSVTQILSQLLSYSEIRNMCIGTSGVFVDGKHYESERTTPDSPDLFYWFKYAKDSGINIIIMEISAHAIFYDKLYGVRCSLCVFTNLSQDHLDFFGTMERYGEVKKNYFCSENMKCAIVNSDDRLGREIIREGKECCISYGIDNPADVFAVNVKNASGTNFVVNIFDDILYIHTQLYGLFNVYNILSAITVSKLLGMNNEQITKGISCVQEVPGRMNVIHWKAQIFIDYAHTPDGLQKALEVCRQMTIKKLIVVFGCGGNRDITKRGIMGKIASIHADRVILTSDNPRDEKEEDIIFDILSGIDNKDNVMIEVDREKAIKKAIEISNSGDVILIAGKGCEEYMEKNGQKVHFSDREVCLKLLEKINCHA